MKFYTHLSYSSIYYLIEKTKYPDNHYKIFHMWFYLCLLPKKIKIYFLKNTNLLTKNAFNSILNVEEEFCSTIDECDYVLLPPTDVFYNRYRILYEYKEYIKTAKKLNKKIIFFLGCDSDKPFYDDGKLGYIFRSSGFLSESSNNVFGLPTINCDVFDNTFLPKKLSISFCGNFTSSKIRSDVINILSEKISDNCNFILRTDWCGTLISGNPKKEYFQNLKENLYCLCVRGGGNFSFRLGETFMMGRIPILIDTDCILPFENLIPYEKNCIRIPEKNINNIVEIIQNYHNSHSEEELLKIQKENRNIWENYFLPSNAFNHIKDIINRHEI